MYGYMKHGTSCASPRVEKKRDVQVRNRQGTLRRVGSGEKEVNDDGGRLRSNACGCDAPCDQPLRRRSARRPPPRLQRPQ